MAYAIEYQVMFVEQSSDLHNHWIVIPKYLCRI